MPPERKRRQDPVSCEQCRKKKLRCDRQLSCANCRLRNLQCTYSTGKVIADIPPADQGQDLDELRTENTDIKLRLQRLEDVILSQHSAAATSTHGRGEAHSASDPVPINTSRPSESTKTFVGDSRWLEDVSAGYNSKSRDLADPLSISIRSIREIQHSLSSTPPSKSILIPTHGEARSLLHLYMDRVDLIQYVIYAPNIAAILEQVYIQLEHGNSCRLSHITLVIGLMASIVNYLGLGEQQDTSFSDTRVAAKLSTYWLRSALSILDQAWRSEPPDVVTVQATMILEYLIYHFEALSSRVRFLHSAAVGFAKDIGLHTTDNDSMHEHVLSKEQIIEVEMRRRIWWHLVATDWSLALCGGPQDGTYLINPKHIRVQKPRNISDEELITMPADFSHPLTKVTPLTYYLHRLRLGEVCREVADLTWDLAGSGVESISYSDVIPPLDQKFEDLINELPVHPTNDDPGRNVSCASRLMTSQRFFTGLTIYARRCKLHLPFLLRVSRNELYETSRKTCLHAARTMLKFHDFIPHSKTRSEGKERVRIVAVLHHFFCAIVVLVMDLCMNPTAGPEDERKAEIQSACNILEEARHYSGSAGVFLEALMDTLQKHKVRMQTQDHDSAPIDGVGNRLIAEPLVTDDTRCNAGIVSSPPPPGDNLDFGDLWQSYLDMGPDIDPRQWDVIFADLDGSV